MSVKTSHSTKKIWKLTPQQVVDVIGDVKLDESAIVNFNANGADCSVALTTESTNAQGAIEVTIEEVAMSIQDLASQLSKAYGSDAKGKVSFDGTLFMVG